MSLCALFDDKLSIAAGARLQPRTALCLMAIKSHYTVNVSKHT